MDTMEKKVNVIKLVQNAKSQPEIKQILDKYYTGLDVGYIHSGNKVIKDVTKLDKMINFIAEDFDIDYKTGVDDNLGSDGKTHDFGKGKFAHCGDNIPADLNYAKTAVINGIKDY